MKKRILFQDIYSNMGSYRWLIVSFLLLFVFVLMFYFNNVRKSLEEREVKYATLYAESIRFFIEKGLDSDCDYSFVQEVLAANETVPTILVTDGVPMDYKNIPELSDSTLKINEKQKNDILYRNVAEMGEEHEPISFNYGNKKGYVYYNNSNIVKQLKYFPIILVLTFMIFGGMAFVAYSSSRRAEQNRVWVGLAKETAHQLGTPISGLLGWIEVMKLNPQFDQTLGDEMLKDINRLETITNRFSNIGSSPTKTDEDVVTLVVNAVEYLKKRISSKIQWSISDNTNASTNKKINKNLVEWVIENICKNAVDAMEGIGTLDIVIFNENNKVVIDIKDSGRGMNSKTKRKVFNAGYSTKKRGWGLGLTLAKRIIETYHSGKILVSETSPGKGSTFRIIL